MPYLKGIVTYCYYGGNLLGSMKVKTQTCLHVDGEEWKYKELRFFNAKYLWSMLYPREKKKKT